MTRKQVCALAAVAAMLFITGVAVWRLSGVSPVEMGGSSFPVGIMTSSIALYIFYLFSTLPNRRHKRK